MEDVGTDSGDERLDGHHVRLDGQGDALRPALQPLDDRLPGVEADFPGEAAI